MKALIADDDPVVMKALVGLLQGWGYETVSVTDGKAAWKILNGPEAPSMAVVDWQMPGMNGDELCRMVRTELPERSLYILLITARNTRVEDKVTGLTAGADDYIARPVAVHEFLARIRLLLRLQRTTAALRVSEQHHRGLVELLPEAVRISRAAAVDVSSGVESRPGVKDLDKIRAFLAVAGALQ